MKHQQRAFGGFHDFIGTNQETADLNVSFASRALTCDTHTHMHTHTHTHTHTHVRARAHRICLRHNLLQ